MVRCFHSRRYRIEQAAGRILTLLETVMVAGLGVYFLVTREDCRREAGALLALGVLIGLYGILSDLINTREYSIDTEGITLRYWKRKTVFYPWSSVSQICVFAYQAGNARGDVIRCIIGKPPKNPRKVLRSPSVFFRFRSVLTMEYTPERLEAFRLCSGRDIPDCRPNAQNP